MKTLISRSPISLFVTCLMICGAGALPVSAQPAESPVQKEKEEPPGLPNGNIIYLPNESGKLVPVPWNATLKEYLRWVDAQSEEPQAQLPEYSIDQLTLTGTANDRLVNLEARMTVRVRKQTGAVTVPLQFNEAVLKEVSHTGDGEFAFNGLKNNTGYEWKMSGEGTHEIRLKLSAPISRQLSSSRLQLTLPPTAVGSLELVVGMRDAAFKTPARTAFEIASRGDTSTITLFGLTENLDLSWQPAPESRDVRPVLQARTTIETRLTPAYVLMKTNQQISTVSGSIQQLEVRLPSGYEIESVKDEENLLETYSEIEGRAGWYRLQLSAPTTGPISLDWNLSRPIPEPGGAFVIDGFELGGDVRLQSGLVKLAELPGFRLQERDRRALFRTDVSVGSDFSRAFEFFRQPFSLTLELQKIQPLYSLVPQLELQVEQQELTWKADLVLSIQRGSLTRLSLQWPGWREAGWRLGSDEQSEMIDGISVDENDPDLLHVRFREPLTGENIRISLKAVRPLNDRDAAAGVKLQLPRFPRRSVSGDSELLITTRPDLKVTLVESGDLEALPVPIPTLEGQASEVVARLIVPEHIQPQLKLSVVPRERIVSVKTNLAVELQTEKTIQVRQSCQYDVRFESLDTLRLRIPTAILASLAIVDQDGSSLEYEPVEGSTEILTPVRIAFTEPRIGVFTIQFQFNFELPVPAAGSLESPTWTLPLIQPAEAVSNLSSLKLNPAFVELYEPAADKWQRADAIPGDTIYTAIGNVVRQEILFQNRLAQPSDELVTVRHCLHVTFTDEDGSMHTRSDYLLNGRFDSLTLRLPENFGLDAQGLELDDRPIPREARVLSGSTLVINVPGNFPLPDDGQQHRLTVTIISSEAAPLNWFGTQTCQAPELIEARRLQQTFRLEAQRSQQTYWLVQLPHQQHLFTQPAGYTPQYLWQRQGFFWVRTPQKSLSELAEWIHCDPKDLQDQLSAAGNVYLFSRFGTGERLVLGSMHQRAVVLAGASLTMLISLMLVRLPATRNALTLLVIAAVLAFAGIWYPTAVALLLQPAILGFGLASLATALDHLFRRPQLPTVVTFEEPTAGSSQVVGISETALPLSQIELGLGSDDPTQMKAREGHEEHVSSHISSGD